MTPSPLRQLRIIWGALVGGVVAYTTVTWSLVSFGDVGMDLLPPSIMNLGGTAAIVMMAAALLLRRKMVEGLSHELPADERLARYQTVTLIGLGGIESVGLFVITLAMVSGAANWILAGGGAAAVLMVTARPSEREIGLD